MIYHHPSAPLFLVFLIAHYFGDFVFQTHWMALNKSSSMRALTAHVLTYSLTIFAVWGIINYFEANFKEGVYLFFITAVTHFITDYFTSRVNSKLWNREKWHEFFLVLGFDQLIHQATLYYSLVFCYSLVLM